jgi:hypothetical protein
LDPFASAHAICCSIICFRFAIVVVVLFFFFFFCFTFASLAGTEMSKIGGTVQGVAAFEESCKTFVGLYQALEAENALLREKVKEYEAYLAEIDVATLFARLAVYEPDVELEQLSRAITPASTPPKEDPTKKKDDLDKKKPEETSKFRAVKYMHFFLKSLWLF